MLFEKHYVGKFLKVKIVTKVIKPGKPHETGELTGLFYKKLENLSRSIYVPYLINGNQIPDSWKESQMS